MNRTRYERLPDGGILLENPNISVTVYPRCGGKIAGFRSGNREWLWQNPRLTLEPVPFGSPYDDHFYGGIDELFPNDFPTTVDGLALPDHGELWSQAWDCDLRETDNGWTVILRLDMRLHAARVERRISLLPNGMLIEETLTNLSGDPIPYLWVLHPAFRIDPSLRLHFPQGLTIVEDEQHGRVRKGTAPFLWPGSELGQDLSRVPERNGGLESYYITNLPEGRFRLEDTETGESLQVEFPADVFPHMWLFMPLGGWRDHYVAVIEPSSGYPTDLAEAVKDGTHSVLQGRSAIQANITFTVGSATEAG